MAEALKISQTTVQTQKPNFITAAEVSTLACILQYLSG
jgi:hypothetical protein